MNVTFILGNGFDMQMGLKSSYGDFIKEYVKSCPDDNENIKKFKAYLKQSGGTGMWSDAEKAFGLHLGQFSDNNIAEYSERLQNFEIKMIEYLEAQQNSRYFGQRDKIRDIFCDFVFRFPDELLANGKQDLKVQEITEDTNFNFLTFNYTNIIDNIIDCCLLLGSQVSGYRSEYSPKHDYFNRPIHIHGTLDTSIIMGVNDESQLDVSKGVTLTQSLKYQLLKTEMNRGMRNNRESDAKKIINRSDVIVFYGVSFGETDNIWWKEIRDWLRGKWGHKIVAFIRDDRATYNRRLAWSELQYQDSKRQEIAKKLGLSDNEQDNVLLEQIYIVINTNKLELKDIIASTPENQINSEKAEALIGQ